MVIKTYNPVTLKEKETITNLKSVIWNRRFYKVGSFEIETTSKKFCENDIIAYKYNGEIRSGIVMKVVEKISGIFVSGYDLKGIFNFRYVTTPGTYNSTPESIIKAMATTNLCRGDRAIRGLSVESINGTGTTIEFSYEDDFLSDIFEMLCTSNEIGIDIEFDLEKMVLKTMYGRDMSELVKFGRKFRNIENVEYTRDIFNTYNVGYSKDENEVETVTGTATGILRRECYKDKNVAEYLKEKAPIESIRAEANDRYKYGIDYLLGDYVSVQTDDVITVKQITEIKEVHERDKNYILPVFGTEKENPLTKILKGV